MAYTMTPGSSFTADGHGDQNVAFGNGVQYNDRSDRRSITCETFHHYLYVLRSKDFPLC
jgi:hypothetical protein